LHGILIVVNFRGENFNDGLRIGQGIHITFKGRVFDHQGFIFLVNIIQLEKSLKSISILGYVGTMMRIMVICVAKIIRVIGAQGLNTVGQGLKGRDFHNRYGGVMF
jgi:hypothetical protein